MLSIVCSTSTRDKNLFVKLAKVCLNHIRKLLCRFLCASHIHVFLMQLVRIIQLWVFITRTPGNTPTAKMLSADENGVRPIGKYLVIWQERRRLHNFWSSVWTCLNTASAAFKLHRSISTSNRMVPKPSFQAHCYPLAMLYVSPYK